MNMTLRPPTPADVPALSQLVYDAFVSIAQRHNFPSDFPAPQQAAGLMEAWVGHPNVFGVVAQADGKIVGCNFLDSRNSIAGVGPICIDPSVQGKGIGRQLMNAVLEAGRSARGIRLVQDAFNTVSMPLYASVGFDVREPLVLMRGRLKSAKHASLPVRALTEKDLPACAALCDRVHGHDRAGELADALKMFKPHVLERGGKIVAYASAPWLWFLNHGVAETEQDLRDVLIGACATSNEPLELLLPTRQANFFRWALSEGMKVVKPMTLMTQGWYQDPRGFFYPSVEY
jgi:predicted N-acetyltransferase YhbS